MTSQQYEVLVLGSGAGGKLLSWHMARAGRRTAVVERKWIGGSCPNINCLPSKNGSGAPKSPISSTTRRRSGWSQARRRSTCDACGSASVRWSTALITMHLDQYRASGAELIMGCGALRGAENGRGASQRRRHARARGRARVPQPGDPCHDSTDPRPRGCRSRSRTSRRSNSTGCPSISSFSAAAMSASNLPRRTAASEAT